MVIIYYLKWILFLKKWYHKSDLDYNIVDWFVNDAIKIEKNDFPFWIH